MTLLYNNFLVEKQQYTIVVLKMHVAIYSERHSIVIGNLRVCCPLSINLFTDWGTRPDWRPGTDPTTKNAEVWVDFMHFSKSTKRKTILLQGVVGNKILVLELLLFLTKVNPILKTKSLFLIECHIQWVLQQRGFNQHEFTFFDQKIFFYQLDIHHLQSS